jgi:hypothetical protein
MQLLAFAHFDKLDAYDATTDRLAEIEASNPDVVEAYRELMLAHIPPSVMERYYRLRKMERYREIRDNADRHKIPVMEIEFEYPIIKALYKEWLAAREDDNG